MSYCDFGEANHLVVKRIACLNAVNDLAGLVITHTRNLSDSLVVIDIEINTVSIYFLYAQRLQGLLELLEDELHAFLDSGWVVALVGNGALEIVENGKNSRK